MPDSPHYVILKDIELPFDAEGFVAMTILVRHWKGYTNVQAPWTKFTIRQVRDADLLWVCIPSMVITLLCSEGYLARSLKYYLPSDLAADNRLAVIELLGDPQIPLFHAAAMGNHLVLENVPATQGTMSSLMIQMAQKCGFDPDATL